MVILVQLDELDSLAAAAQGTRTSLADLMSTARELAAAIQAGGLSAQASSVAGQRSDASQAQGSSQPAAQMLQSGEY